MQPCICSRYKLRQSSIFSLAVIWEGSSSEQEENMCIVWAFWCHRFFPSFKTTQNLICCCRSAICMTTHAAEGKGRSHWITQEGCVKHRHKPMTTCLGNFFSCCHIMKDSQVHTSHICSVSLYCKCSDSTKIYYLPIVFLCIILYHLYGGGRDFECAGSTTRGCSEPREVQAIREGEKWWWAPVTDQVISLHPSQPSYKEGCVRQGEFLSLKASRHN